MRLTRNNAYILIIWLIVTIIINDKLTYQVNFFVGESSSDIRDEQDARSPKKHPAKILEKHSWQVAKLIYVLTTPSV